MLENSYMYPSANSGDPDEIPYNTAFHQGLHSLLRQKWSSEKEMLFYFENDPSNYKNEPSEIDCIKPEGRIQLLIYG